MATRHFVNAWLCVPLPLFSSLFRRWGRRVSFLLMIYMAVTLSVATAFSPNYTVYMVIRVLNGLTFPSLFQIPYILGNNTLYKSLILCNIRH